MRVKFYVFSKKYNSTLRPTSDLNPQEYDCVLKSSSSVISPTLELNYGLILNPSQYNYCYIEDYGRYYWITEWTFMKSYWLASLSVDVLATWRPYIGNTDMYVYRSSYEYNPKVPDGAYSTTGEMTVVKENMDWVTVNLESGYYIVAVYGVENANTSTLSYYSFTASNFKAVLNKLYATVSDDGLWQSIVTGVRNSLFNPSDYIASCKWSPFEPDVYFTQELHEIWFGNLHLSGGFTCNKISFSSDGSTFKVYPRSSLLRIPKHPVSQTRGVCYNLNPYSEYELIYFPFGTIKLNSNLLMDRDFLKLVVSVDVVTGNGILTVTANNYNSDYSQELDVVTVAIRTCKFLVDIPILYSKGDNFAVIQNATYEAINRTYASKSATATLTGIHLINAFTELAIPDIEITGTASGVAYLGYHNMLQCIFYGVADDDNDSRGRPLLKVRKPMNIPGYIEGESSNFKAPATESEQVEVRNFIERGFYYE